VRRLILLLSALVLVVGVLPVAATAHQSSEGLELSVAKAPVAPDGTTAGSQPDFVVMFADPDPAADGVGILAGGTITIELDPAFDLSGDQGLYPSGPPPPAILLQGWPQSPRVGPFPYDTKIDGNTVTLTLVSDWPVGTFGPGPKSVHLPLLASQNPSTAGRYAIDVSIKPDPGSSDTLSGHGHVGIIPKVRPSVNVMSLFSGPPGPPPPFFNPLYQDVQLGVAGRQVGMYLWERGGQAAVGVDIEMLNSGHGRLVQDGSTVGHVWIQAPKGARDHTIESTGPSVETPAFFTGVPTGLWLTQFTPDPNVAGEYRVTISINGGNEQTMHYTVGD
jgi:hypothetical protein